MYVFRLGLSRVSVYGREHGTMFLHSGHAHSGSIYYVATPHLISQDALLTSSHAFVPGGKWTQNYKKIAALMSAASLGHDWMKTGTPEKQNRASREPGKDPREAYRPSAAPEPEPKLSP